MIILMKRQTKTILISVFPLAVLCASACGKKESVIVGSWRHIDSLGNSTTITFNSDGTYVEIETTGLVPEGLDYTGRYEVDEANSTITLHTDPIPGDRVGYAPDLVCRYLLIGDKLTLYYYYDTQETAFTYTKVKT